MADPMSSSTYWVGLGHSPDMSGTRPKVDIIHGQTDTSLWDVRLSIVRPAEHTLTLAKPRGAAPAETAKRPVSGEPGTETVTCPEDDPARRLSKIFLTIFPYLVRGVPDWIRGVSANGRNEGVRGVGAYADRLARGIPPCVTEGVWRRYCEAGCISEGSPDLPKKGGCKTARHSRERRKS
jgi:hypothetical protein